MCLAILRAGIIALFLLLCRPASAQHFRWDTSSAATKANADALSDLGPVSRRKYVEKSAEDLSQDLCQRYTDELPNPECMKTVVDEMIGAAYARWSNPDKPLSKKYKDARDFGIDGGYSFTITGNVDVCSKTYEGKNPHVHNFKWCVRAVKSAMAALYETVKLIREREIAYTPSEPKQWPQVGSQTGSPSPPSNATTTRMLDVSCVVVMENGVGTNSQSATLTNRCGATVEVWGGIMLNGNPLEIIPAVHAITTGSAAPRFRLQPGEVRTTASYEARCCGVFGWKAVAVRSVN